MAWHEITNEAELFDRAFVRKWPTVALQERWTWRYLDSIRDRRIDRLVAFLRHAARMARDLEDGRGWYGDHVVWAIDRLCILGYTFPEIDDHAHVSRARRHLVAITSGQERAA